MSNIIIPSKNIYKIENPKVINNSIIRLETEAKNIKINKDFNSLAYSQTTQTSDLFEGIYFNGNDEKTDILSYFDGLYSFSSYSFYSIYYYAYAAIAGSRGFMKRINFKIPKNTGEKYIESLFSGKDENGNNYIKKSVTYRHQDAFLSVSAKKIGDDSTTESTTRYSLNFLSALVFDDGWETQSGSLPNSAISVSYSPSNSAPKVSASFPSFDETNLSKIDFSFDEKDQTYNCSVDVLCGFMSFSSVIKQKGESGHYPETISNSGTGIDDNGNEYGYLKLYQPLSVQFSFYGNILELDITEEKFTIGSAGSEKTFHANSSEILQQPINPDLFNPIIKQYEKGKETAKIKCSISDYYDNNGVIYIDTKTGKMSFNIGDFVIPMVFGADGKDRPMSKYRDGTPKVFRVVGIKFVYDGAVWQELTLQEAEREEQ